MSTAGSDDNNEHDIFPHVFVDRSDDPLYEEGDRARTITAQRMSLLSYALRSKPSWWIKYKDPSIRSKWRKEALEQVALDGKLTEAEVDYVLDELDGYERLREEATGVMFRPDLAIGYPYSSRASRPTDCRVLDLVHPSLYCLVYGRTRAYPIDSDPKTRTAEDLKTFEEPWYIDTEAMESAHEYAVSTKFAWIFTDFHIAEGGGSAKAKSYINNLHPSHTGLYKCIEALVARFSHLFDRVLTDLHPSNPLPVRTSSSFYYDDGPEDWPEQKEGESSTDYGRRYEEWKENRPMRLPTVEGAYSGTLHDRKIRYSIQGRDVQIIVKLANIHLTPEKPEYKGGSWHIEGMANEFIVASGIYYYSSENITTNQLAFRESVVFDGDYEQDDSNGVRRAWGLVRDEGCSQNLGAVDTIEGRCIAFPNIYQHQVSPFKLIDPTKPGHRKIVALFLSDPSRGPMPSTSVIPPQQADWIRSALSEVPTNSKLHTLPVELLDMISHGVTTTMTEEEAKKYREELMDERTAFVGEQDAKFFEAEFNMCEH
ncbi:hypothetical protein FRC02_009612 [Tulasnella sp. 418]|nr:hypothetical protein FRC02_009612 [Tulasnella sp. 418]